jgi:two-component system, OmpR family, phosphate regulon sensor histidine kinase PhoR
MTSPADLSIYDLVAQGKPLTSVLQVSPMTLKSISDAMVSLLNEQKIPALVWAKLPRGGIWWTELERYASLSGIPLGLYWVKNQRDEGDEGNEAGQSPETANPSSIAVGDETSAGNPSDNAPHADKVPLFSAQLSTNHSLRQEYFLIIQSDQFCGAFFAQRLLSEPLQKAGDAIARSTIAASTEKNFSIGQPAQALESTPDRKQLLTVFCSFDGDLIRQALTGLETAIAHLPELAAHWQPLLNELSTPAINPDLISLLFSKHLQHQEDLWQRNSTYRKQSEGNDSLRLQNEELVNAIRLKDDFLNTVGQELRTPLTTIKTALSLLGSNSIKPPQRQRYMDLIAKECDRQSSLITSLLDLVHLEQVAEQSALPAIQISDVVPGVVSTYLPLAEEKSIRLGYTVPDNLPPVSCMASWLKQIAINLLHNGIKFTPSGGQVWVRIKQQGEYVQFEVSDTGIGIAQNEIPKIFDRFYRVRNSADDSSGAGLGLTIVQQLLLHCGGSISVKSKPGEGTTFNVLLPIHRHVSEPMI